MRPADVIDALINNEPATAVEAFQSLVRARAEQAVAERFRPAEVTDATAPQVEEE